MIVTPTIVILTIKLCICNRNTILLYYLRKEQYYFSQHSSSHLRRGQRTSPLPTFLPSTCQSTILRRKYHSATIQVQKTASAHPWTTKFSPTEPATSNNLYGNKESRTSFRKKQEQLQKKAGAASEKSRSSFRRKQEQLQKKAGAASEESRSSFSTRCCDLHLQSDAARSCPNRQA